MPYPSANAMIRVITISIFVESCARHVGITLACGFSAGVGARAEYRVHYVGESGHFVGRKEINCLATPPHEKNTPSNLLMAARSSFGKVSASLRE